MNYLKTIITISIFSMLFACKNIPTTPTTKKKSTVVAAAPKSGDPMKLDSSKRYIYLSWDDSPQPPGTTVCKNVFHNQGVKATFFVVGGNQIGPFKARIVDSLRNSYPEFLMANHSYSHANNDGKDNYSLFYKRTDSAVEDFLKNEKQLQVAVKIIRLPGNNSWAGNGKIQGPKSTLAVCKRLDSLGYKVIGWDIEWNQNKTTPKESVAEMIKKVNDKFESGYTFEQNCLVILSHDRLFAKPQYADSLNKFIAILKQDPRNVFETLDHYPLVMRK